MRNISKKVVIFFFVSLLPFLWMDFPYVRTMEERLFLNYAIVLRKYLFSWVGHLNLGFPTSPFYLSLAFPNSVFYYLGGLLGLDISVIQALFLSLVIFATLLSIHTLVSYLTRSRTAALLASLFYISNFYSATTSFYSAKMYQLILMPLFFVFLSNFLETRKYKYAVYNFISLFLFQAVFSNLPQVAITFSVYLVAILYFKLNNKGTQWRSVLWRALFFFLPLSPLFFYHGLIYFFYALYTPGSFQGIKQATGFTALSSRMSDVFQLRGAWWERIVGYNDWLWFYEHPLVILASFALVVIVFGYLLLLQQRGARKNYLFFATFLLLSILLTVGTTLPFFYSFLYRHVPFFYIFREPWAKFVPLTLFFFAILLGYVISSIKKRELILLLAFLILIRGANLFSPRFFRHDVQEGSYPEFRLPQYWKDFEEFSREPSFEGRLVLVTPLAGTGSTYYWYPGRGNTSIFLPAYYTDFDLLSGFSRTLDFDPGLATIQYFPVQFVLRQNDATVDNEKSVYLGFEGLVEKGLVEDEPAFSFGNGALELYKTRKDKFAPKFFVPTKTVYVGSERPDFSEVMFVNDFGTYGPRAGIYLENSNLKSQISNLENGRILERADEIFVVGERDESKAPIMEPEWSKGWAWPEANVRPGTWKYPLVRLKEWWAEWRAREPLEKADVLLWHGTKRIEEIKKINEREITEIGKLARDYLEGVGAAIEILKWVPVEKRDDGFFGMVGKTLAYMERAETEITEIKKLTEIGSEEIEEIWKLREGFKEWAEGIWPVDPCRGKYCFEVEVPEAGDYEIYTDLEVLDTEIRDIGSGRSLPPTAGRKEKNGTSFGGMEFGEGKRLLELKVPEASSLADENLVVEEEFVRNNQAFYGSVLGWGADKKYKVSFDYRLNGGPELLVKLLEGRGEGENLGHWAQEVGKIAESGEGGKEWPHFEETVESSSDAKKGWLYIYTEGLGEGFEKIEFDNIEVREVLEPRLILRKLGTEITKTREIPKITFVKVNPTKYRVKVEGVKEPYTLIFSESFHQGWRIYEVQSSKFKVQSDYGEIVASYFDGEIREGTHRNTFLEPSTFETWGRKPITADHLLVNGYANSWYIKPEDVGGAEDYELIIEFWPQRWFYAGMMVSLVTLLGCLGYLGYDSVRRWR